MITLYGFSRFLIKTALRLYFHKIKIEGLENIPKNTPIIVTPNHQNAFLDAFLIGAFSPFPLYYLTRSDVFTWWSKPILKSVHMMPVFRIRDGYSKLSQNGAVFESCRELFNANKSVLIFAEGNHGEHYYLRSLTKGAARLAIQSQQAMDRELMIQPVGLNFFDHQSPKTTVLIKFGEPVAVKPFLKGYEKNQAQGLIRMRDAISEGMKSTLVIPEKTEDYDERVKKIFQLKHEHHSFEELKSSFSTEELVDPNRKRKRHAIAWTLNPLPFLVIRRIIGRIDDIVFHSSIKFATGLFLFPIWWMIIFLILSFAVGINIALLAVIVMVSGLFYSYQR